MLKNLIKKMVNEVMAEKTDKPDQSAELAAAKKENEELKQKLASTGPAKRLEKLKELVAAIPEGAQGMGAISIIEDGVLKNVPLKSKKDLTDIIDRAEKNEIEVFTS